METTWLRWRPFIITRDSTTMISFALLFLILGTTTTGVRAICPAKCSCDDETLVVRCESANLDIVPITLNPGVRHLFLRHNNIRAVIAAFGFYKDLEVLDLSHNKLLSLETRCFEYQSRLRSLHLSRNQIGSVINDTFLGLISLRILRLDSNLLKEIADRAFVHLRNVDELDLSSNLISIVRPEAFIGLGGLKTLKLDDNRLTRIPAVANLAPMRSLQHLALDANPLLAVEPSAFSTLPSLTELGLSNCQLRDFGLSEEGALKGLHNLRVLRLRDNALTRVPPASEWVYVSRLEQLALGGNAFDELPAASFSGLRSLRIIEANNCPRLRAVRSRAFSGNVELQSIALNHNSHLSLLEAGAFDGLPNLSYLGLRDNALYAVSENSLPTARLEILDIRDNPIHCNCSVLWLQSWLQKRNATLLTSSSSNLNFPGSNFTVSAASVAHVKCRSPVELDQKSLMDLNVNDLGCYSPNARQQAVFGIAGAVAVACVATLIFLVYKYRKPVTRVLKDQWTEGPLRSKDVHYEKTNDDEENTILQTAAQQSLKMTPVTEL